MAMNTHLTDLSTDNGPTYNISGSCLWTLATIVPLTILLLILAF